MNEPEAVPYYTAAQVRELDRIAIEECGIPGFTLMQRAGNACFDVLRERWPEARSAIVCCGTGNNGGDGFVIAALCREAGMDAAVFLLGDPQAISGDARRALELARKRGVQIRSAADLEPFLNGLQEPAVLVDALLGTGLRGPVREPVAAFIRCLNNSRLPILAVDMPSGLCSDSGEVLGAAVHAAATVSFIGRKLGSVRGSGPACCGACLFSDLQVPPEVYNQITPAAVL